MWCIYTTEHYSFIKTNEIMSFEARWMDLGLSYWVKCREENDKYHMPARTHDLKRDTRSQEQGFLTGMGLRHKAAPCEALGPACFRGSSSELADNQCRLGLGCRWSLWKKRAGRREAFLPSQVENYSSQPWRKTPWTWDLSPSPKEAECLERGTERHRRSTKNLKHREAVTKGPRQGSPWKGYLLLSTSV